MPRTNKRISGITVEGFKSIWTETFVDIRPLTILAGANSSGKSSIMQPVLLLKQTIEAPADPGALLLDGQNARFTAAEQMLPRAAGKPGGNQFCIAIQSAENSRLKLVFVREPGKGFEIARMEFSNGREASIIREDMAQPEIAKVIPSHFQSLRDEITKEVKQELDWRVVRERCFLGFELVGKGQPPQFRGFRVSPSGEFVSLIQGVIHLPGLRGNPQRTYPRTAGGPYYQGTFETYVASVIAQWQDSAEHKLASLAGALETMELTWKVTAKALDDTRLELQVGRLVHARAGGSRDLVSIADVGFGVSQSLPVVVALVAAGSGHLVYLEQPEIHLHPNAQRRLAHLLRQAVDRGVVIVIETHSSLLLREVQTLVAHGELAKEDVALHWFERSKEDGSTKVTRADLHDDGSYGPWPQDFDETELASQKDFLDAVEARSVKP